MSNDHINSEIDEVPKSSETKDIDDSISDNSRKSLIKFTDYDHFNPQIAGLDSDEIKVHKTVVLQPTNN